MALPKVWTESFEDYISSALRNEAAKYFRIHQLPEDIDSWFELRQRLRKQLWARMGTCVDHDLDLDLRITGEVRMEGYTVKKVCYQSRPGLYVTGNLYVPDGKGPFPGILGMHGHWSQGRLAERVQSRGHSLAKSGYVCLSVDAFGSGERSTVHGEFEYHGGNLGGSLFDIGESLMGMQIVDNMRGIDVLCSLDYVDSERIGATGASGGGNQTMWVAAMDERIKACVPVVSVGSFESYIMRTNCVCEVLPDGLTFTEEAGVLALVAPRALKICNCIHDSNPTFFPAEMLRSFKETRKVFKAYDADSKLSYQVFNQPHGYWPEIREVMLGWFDFHLKGIGHGSPRQEEPFDTLTEEEVMVFEKGQRPAEVGSIAEFCRAKADALRNDLNGKASFDSAIEIAELKKTARIHSLLKLKEAYEYTAGDGWRKFALESECGRMIPVLVKESTDGSKDFTVAAAPEGKEQLEQTASFESLLKSGKGIVVFDPWGTGETAAETGLVGGVTQHDLARSCLWLSKTLVGEWAKDYLLVVEWANQALNASSVSLFGFKDCGFSALIASAVSESELAVTAEEAPVSFKMGEQAINSFFSMGIHIPGFLNWGDVSLLAALTGAKIKLLQPVFMDGAKLSMEDKECFGAEFAETAKKCSSKTETKLI